MTASNTAAVLDAHDWNRSMLGVKALLSCTEGELECIGEKLLDQYIAEVNAVYVAMSGYAALSQPAAAPMSGPTHEFVAYAEDGKLHWLTGRKFDNCKLYTRPAAPGTEAAPVEQDAVREQLVAALEEVVDSWDCGSVDHATINKVRAALAAAGVSK